MIESQHGPSHGIALSDVGWVVQLFAVPAGWLTKAPWKSRFAGWVKLSLKLLGGSAKDYTMTQP